MDSGQIIFIVLAAILVALGLIAVLHPSSPEIIDSIRESFSEKLKIGKSSNKHALRQPDEPKRRRKKKKRERR